MYHIPQDGENSEAETDEMLTNPLLPSVNELNDISQPSWQWSEDALLSSAQWSVGRRSTGHIRAWL